MILFQAKAAHDVKRVKVTPPKKETPLKTNTRGRKKVAVQGKFITRVVICYISNLSQSVIVMVRAGFKAFFSL